MLREIMEKGIFKINSPGDRSGDYLQNLIVLAV
jgi:hypothetical protein